MANCLFNKLPSELVCEIFVSLSDIGDVVHLARSSGIFNEVWRNNGRSICSTVMPRSILCFQDTRSLLEAQEDDEEV